MYGVRCTMYSVWCMMYSVRCCAVLDDGGSRRSRSEKTKEMPHCFLFFTVTLYTIVGHLAVTMLSLHVFVEVMIDSNMWL